MAKCSGCGCGELHDLGLVDVRGLATIQGAREDGARNKVFFGFGAVWQPSDPVDLWDALLDAFGESGTAVSNTNTEVRPHITEIMNQSQSSPHEIPNVPLKEVPTIRGGRKKKDFFADTRDPMC